jgi:hypothetical protein
MRDVISANVMANRLESVFEVRSFVKEFYLFFKELTAYIRRLILNLNLKISLAQNSGLCAHNLKRRERRGFYTSCRPERTKWRIMRIRKISSFKLNFWGLFLIQ